MILLNNTGQKQNDTSHDETDTHLINLVNESWKNTTEMYLYDCLCKRKNQKMILVIKYYKHRRETQNLHRDITLGEVLQFCYGQGEVKYQENGYQTQ